MSDFLRMHVYVTGRVQGVWFRESTRSRASELGVGGWVRNLPDGRVEALFEGAPDAVRAAVEFVHHGPPRADVESVEAEELAVDAVEEDASPRAGSFRIR